MEQQQKDEVGVTASTADADNLSSGKSAVKAKRSPRMLYESSFATSFTSVRGQKRPPGFLSSSLDYRSTGTRSADPATVTTKPGRNSKHNKQQQQQGKSDSDQQRYYRPGQSQPTRAQGNFGPPPHSVKTLEDLENMSEEQIYKLFMDDPELYETFMKTTERGGSSAPTRSRKARRSTGKKPASNAKTKRDTTKSKTIKSQPIDREVPYFQWLSLLILVGVVVYQCRKIFSTPETTKERIHVTSKKPRGGKQKFKRGGKSEKKSVPKTKHVSRETVPISEKKDAADKQKSVGKLSSKTKKKKRGSKLKSNGNEKASANESEPLKYDQEQKSDLNSSDVSSRDNESDIPSQIESPTLSDPANSETIDDESNQEWQTVTKSSRSSKKEKKTTSSQDIVEDKSIAESAMENVEDGGASSNESKKNTLDLDENDRSSESAMVEEKEKKESNSSSKNVADKANDSKDTVGNTNEANSSVSDDEKASQAKSTEKSSATSKSAATTEDDAALALQLHKEEVNLARAAVGNPQEVEWEEVQVRRKRA